MKFSSIPAIGALFAVASATYTQHIDVVCTDSPSTVTQTVTVTAAPGNNHAANPSPYVTTKDGSVTSVDYSGSKTSVWVYPTGSASHDCTVAIYENNIVNVIIVNINVQIINGSPVTVTSTKTGEKPTWTPQPPSKPVTSSTTTTTAPGSKKTHNVIVGADGELKYAGNQIDAAIGDIIRFDFNSTNHTVTESDFNTPCEPKAGGFNTGFNQFNNLSRTGVIFRDFEVKVSTPLWFYCAQTVKASHCHKGMVLGVNAAGKFAEFLAKATATSSSASSPTSSIILSTGYPSKPYSSTSVSKPLSTGVYTSSSTTSSSSSKSTSSTSTKPYGTGNLPAPTGAGQPIYPSASTIAHPKGRRAAAWYA